MTDIETKEKIMNAARVLFANQGYEGTSVREIAKTAEVNVASVNYYFSSKEKLFQEILHSGYVECAAELRACLAKNQGNLENTLVDFFRHFLENSHDLLSHFKMMMSSQHSHNLVTHGTEDGTFGPPGGMVIAETLRKASPDSSDADIHWGLKTLFSHVTHLSLIHTCCSKNNPDIPFSTAEDLERSIRRVTRMVISELKNPQHNANNS
jgi:AcrR family transcriptional regulator